MKLKTTVYKNLTDANDIVEIESGKTIKECFPEINFENAKIIVNGKEEKQDYRTKENDLIVIRILPSAATAAVITAIVAVVAVVAVGAVAGYQMYQNKKKLQKLQDELDKLKRDTNNDATTNLPFINGSSNTLATGKSMPFICGRQLFTPYLLGNRFYKIEGDNGKDQYVEEALELGFKPVVLNKINVDDITVKTFSDSEPQQESGKFQDSFFSNSDYFEIVQNIGSNQFGGTLGSLNTRINSNTIDSQIPYQKDVFSGDESELKFTLDSYAKDVEICVDFPSGFYATDDEGNQISTSANVWAEYSLDGGKTWKNEANEAVIRGQNTDTVASALRAANCFVPVTSGKVLREYQPGYTYKGASITSGTITGESEKIIAEKKSELENEYPIKNYIIEYSNLIATENKFTKHNYRQDYRVYSLNRIEEVPEQKEETLTYKFNMKRTIESRYIIKHEFSKSDFQELKANNQNAIVIRVRYNANKDGQIVNQCYVKYYQSKCYDPKVYKKTGAIVDCPLLEDRERSLSAMLGIRIKATASSEEKLKKISVVCTGLARTWNGSKWSEAKTPTRNPASWLLEILTSPTHELSRFRDDEIDLESFGALYEYCENNSTPLYFDYTISNKATKEDAVNKCLEV